MHTVMVIAIGIALLAICVGAGRLFGVGLARGALLFIPLWFVGALINLWIGVSRAGYSVAAETPIFLIVFGVPAAIALLLRNQLRAS